MLYLDNPGKKASRRRRRRVTLDKKRRKVYRRKRSGTPIIRHSSGRLPRRRHAKGVTVARRRRRRRHVARATPRRRHIVRRRRSPVVRRRRRRFRTASGGTVLAHRRPPRRRFRRNPSFLGGGLTNAVMTAAKDGAVVFVGQVAARKIGKGLDAMIPATVAQNSPGLRGIISRGAGAIVTTLAARKLAPGYAKLAAAGAFSELIAFAVNQNATAASFLSAYSTRILPRTNGYPALPAGRVHGIGAFPVIGLPTTVGN